MAFDSSIAFCTFTYLVHQWWSNSFVKVWIFDLQKVVHSSNDVNIRDKLATTELLLHLKEEVAVWVFKSGEQSWWRVSSNPKSWKTAKMLLFIFSHSTDYQFSIIPQKISLKLLSSSSMHTFSKTWNACQPNESCKFHCLLKPKT